MLTRLRVKGFKNLVDVDVHFGPFTCVAGANGVGKSNLFDAIRFLSALASGTFSEAVRTVRANGGGHGDARDLPTRVGDVAVDRLTFVADMLIPRSGVDDFGQEMTARNTLLRYTLELNVSAARVANGGLELHTEELVPVPAEDVSAALAFPHSAEWRDSAVVLSNPLNSGQYIRTSVAEDGRRLIRHEHVIADDVPDKLEMLIEREAASMPRTMVSLAMPAVLARQEMQSWRLLQLESAALRKPDDFSAVKPSTQLGPDGAHLPATLYRLAREATGKPGVAGNVYERVANRLHELIREIRRVDVDHDEKRELLTLMATDSRGTRFAARDLSDGTLRFLALTVLELDPGGRGLICFEEPENGIHPLRIPAIMRLLKDIAVDADLPVGPDNPLQQVIVNTHSPGVVGEVDADDLLYAEAREQKTDGQWHNGVTFKFPPDTWRHDYWKKSGGKGHPPLVSPGQIKAYLAPVRPDPPAPDPPAANGDGVGRPRLKPARVADRPEYRRHLFSDAEAGQ